MDRKVFFALLAYTAAALFVYLLYIILRPFLPAMGWAAVVAIATFPLCEHLRRRLRWSETWVSALMTLLVFLLLVVPGVVIGLMLVQEIVHAQEYINQWSADDRRATFEELLKNPWVAGLLQEANEFVARFNIDIRAAAVQAGRRLLSLLFGSLTGIAKQAVLFVFQLLLMLVVLFFFYRDGRKLTGGLWSALPIPQVRKELIHDTVEKVVSAVVIGVLATATIQGLLAGVGYWIVGLPSPVLLGTLTAIAALVPVIGTMLVWVPAVAYLLLIGHTTAGLVLLGWSVLAVGSADNFLRPLLISGRTGLPFALMALGAIGGLAAFGFFGLVVGPLILAVFMLVFEMYRTDVIELPASEAPSGMARRRRRSGPRLGSGRRSA